NQFSTASRSSSIAFATPTRSVDAPSTISSAFWPSPAARSSSSSAVISDFHPHRECPRNSASPEYASSACVLSHMAEPGLFDGSIWRPRTPGVASERACARGRRQRGLRSQYPAILLWRLEFRLFLPWL